MLDIISLSRLKVLVHIGVPDEERASPQQIEISLEMTPSRTLFKTDDDLKNTVDYYQVAQDVVMLAKERPRKLIETLNEEILTMVLSRYPLKSATITIYKYIIPETDHVSIKMSLSKDQLA